MPHSTQIALLFGIMTLINALYILIIKQVNALELSKAFWKVIVRVAVVSYLVSGMLFLFLHANMAVAVAVATVTLFIVGTMDTHEIKNAPPKAQEKDV